MKKIVFVVGSPHSGTTWLGLVLGAHKNAFPVGEFFRITRDYANMAAHKANFEMPCALCKGSCKFWKKVRKLQDFDKMYEYVFEYSGADIIVDSSKKVEYVDAVIASSKYEVKIVFIDRNPADAIYHYFARGRGDKKRTIKWLEGHQTKLKHLEGKDLIKISYEKAFDIKELKKVGDFIGIDVDASMYKYWETPIHSIVGASSAMTPVMLYRSSRRKQRVMMPTSLKSSATRQSRYRLGTNSQKT